MNVQAKVRVWLVRILALLGFWGGFLLSLEEWRTNTACPDIVAGVPACYVVTGLFLFIMIGSMWFQHAKSVLLVSLVGTAFAGFATTQNILYGNVCPVTSFGMPQCYLAVSLFLTISLLLIWQHHTKRKISFSEQY